MQAHHDGWAIATRVWAGGVTNLIDGVAACFT